MRKFKVLDHEWNVIIVSEVDKLLHRHLSGREFTQEDNVVFKSKSIEVEIPTIELPKEITLEQAREMYKEKYWKKPNWMMKLETILSKL